MSLLITAGQRGGFPQFQPVLEKINVPRIGAGRPRERPDKVRADKAYGSRANRVYLPRRGISRTIRKRPTKSATARAEAAGAVDRPRSAPSTTGSATPWSAASTGSNDTVPWPRDATEPAVRYETTLHSAIIDDWLACL